VAIDLVGCPELLKLAPCRVALKGEMTNPTKSRPFNYLGSCGTLKER
jgi:hypothetical protein